MSRCEKFVLVTCLLILLLGLLHLYRVQSTMSSTSFHFVQPEILPAESEDEKLHINSKEQKKTSSSAIEANKDSTTFTETTSSTRTSTEVHSSSSSTEVYSSSTSMDPSSTETTSESANTNLVVFYNRWSSCTYNTHYCELPCRIPKTGSENMAFIIKELSKQNDFKQKRFARNDRGPLTEAEASLLDMQNYRTSFFVGKLFSF